MNRTNNEIAREIYRRRNEAVWVADEPAGSWSELRAPNCCHKNVEGWVLVHPGTRPVYGWLIQGDLWDFRFMAHSVVENEDGNLTDITARPSGERYRFLRDIGNRTSFEMFKSIAVLYYTPDYLDYQEDGTR
jgi:hypothetical protein